MSNHINKSAGHYPVPELKTRPVMLSACLNLLFHGGNASIRNMIKVKDFNSRGIK